jgi:putative mRNA 3-end processing factor
MAVQEVLKKTPAGLYCPAGDFTIDPQKPVERALVTHAHADHARPGMGAYLCARSGAELLRLRVDKTAPIEQLPFGKPLRIGGATISFHPAGHILGSAQVRVEVDGRVAVVTGDHNAAQEHLTAEPFTPVPCHLLVTETTFALPIYRWQPQAVIIHEIEEWWRRNQEKGRTSVIACYPLGKTQRLLQALDPEIGPIAILGNGKTFLEAYRRQGVDLPEPFDLKEGTAKEFKGIGLVLVSASGQEPVLLKKLSPFSLAGTSGWLQVRGVRRNSEYDRGFVLSDHSDWPALLKVIKSSRAEQIWPVHGQGEALMRYLQEHPSLAEVDCL